MSDSISDGQTAPKPGRRYVDIIHEAGVELLTVSDPAIAPALRNRRGPDVWWRNLRPRSRIRSSPRTAASLSAGNAGLMLSGSDAGAEILRRVLEAGR